MGLRAAAAEDVRDALAQITQGLEDATTSQYVLRVKSFLGYATNWATCRSTRA
jgi:hypothetical protein